ncbi:hypothetical protein [Cohnella thermotolerans]|uniref:hypothetical protein n=1 Tax=Cohnella thermotolerans TaxID=329858 RepID=UPI0003F8EC06|nr:hypothetical protein [Cohnella thermotolerans]
MRSGIRQRLIAEIPEIDGRVLESHEDGASADKPYLVLFQGAEAGINDWTGFGRTYEVWPYQAPDAGFASVDELSEAVIRALDGETLTDESSGEVFTCRYEGTVGSDVSDEARNALTRGLRFSVAAIEPAEQAEEAPGDDWIEALKGWTQAALGAGWSVYGGKWPPGYAAPAVMWRVVGLETMDGNAAAVKIRKQVTGHVLGRTLNEQTAAVARLAEELKRSGKIALNSEAKQFISIQACAAITEADALRSGQLSVTLMRRSARPTGPSPGDAPLMREVFYHRVSR